MRPCDLGHNKRKCDFAVVLTARQGRVLFANARLRSWIRSNLCGEEIVKMHPKAVDYEALAVFELSSVVVNLERVSAFQLGLR